MLLAYRELNGLRGTNTLPIVICCCIMNYPDLSGGPGQVGVLYHVPRVTIGHGEAVFSFLYITYSISQKPEVRSDPHYFYQIIPCLLIFIIMYNLYG